MSLRDQFIQAYRILNGGTSREEQHKANKFIEEFTVIPVQEIP
jgi:hypothetical protein